MKKIGKAKSKAQIISLSVSDEEFKKELKVFLKKMSKIQDAKIPALTKEDTLFECWGDFVFRYYPPVKDDSDNIILTSDNISKALMRPDHYNHFTPSIYVPTWSLAVWSLMYEASVDLMNSTHNYSPLFNPEFFIAIATILYDEYVEDYKNGWPEVDIEKRKRERIEKVIDIQKDLDKKTKSIIEKLLGKDEDDEQEQDKEQEEIPQSEYGKIVFGL